MSADAIFSICNSTALLGWLVLAIGGRARWASSLVIGVILPLLLAFVYTGLLIGHWGESKGGFGSLTDVAALFSNHWVLLAGWIHYLAFDLFMGSWEVRDAQAHGISHFLVIPCLFFTFMFGPVGLLLYFVIRGVRTKTLGVVE
jgi:membrane protein insertase Oxa1/YidC/SpoIIIJ